VSDRPLRVCLLLDRYPPDFTGWGIQVERLLPHLEARGVEPRVVTRVPAPGVSGTDAADDRVLRILPERPGALGRLAAARRLRAHWRAERPDVLHAALADWELYANLPWLARRGLPVLFEMVLLGADDPVTIARQRLGGLKRRALRHVGAWVGITDAFRARVVQAGFAEERFHCVYPGVDAERYRPPAEAERAALRRSLDIPEDARVLVSVGSLMPRKGMDRLLAAWARLAPRSGKDLLLVVGPTCEAEGLRPRFLEHAAGLRARAEAAPLRGTVRFPGRVADGERWLAAADAFAFLSRQEGFGIVIAEAMACGLPCVVSPMDGIGAEIVDEGETGYVVERPDDAEAVARRLAALLGDAALRAALGVRARRVAVERFSMQARADRLVALYRELVGRAAPR
jgi:glycosyltransferase involved in cell wall biosynthesis